MEDFELNITTTGPDLPKGPSRKQLRLEQRAEKRKGGHNKRIGNHDRKSLGQAHGKESNANRTKPVGEGLATPTKTQPVSLKRRDDEPTESFGKPLETMAKSQGVTSQSAPPKKSEKQEPSPTKTMTKKSLKTAASVPFNHPAAALMTQSHAAPAEESQHTAGHQPSRKRPLPHQVGNDAGGQPSTSSVEKPLKKTKAHVKPSDLVKKQSMAPQLSHIELEETKPSRKRPLKDTDQSKLSEYHAKPSQLASSDAIARPMTSLPSHHIFSKQKFHSLGLHERLVSILEASKEKHGFGLATTTKVQSVAIPILVTGRNAFIRSQTGSGKARQYNMKTWLRVIIYYGMVVYCRQNIGLPIAFDSANTGYSTCCAS